LVLDSESWRSLRIGHPGPWKKFAITSSLWEVRKEKRKKKKKKEEKEKEKEKKRKTFSRLSFGYRR
jgi:hypothetical protein